MNELMGSTANEEFERRIAASWWLESCRLEDSCCENVCFVGSYSLARFEGASGFVGYEVECDGASDNENDDDPEKTGNQCDIPVKAALVSMASMASMASIGKHKGALTWKSPWCLWWWRRMVASMVGVDGGLGSSTQRALTWKSLCVSSSDGHTHSCSFAFRLNSLQNTSGFFVPVSRSRFETVCCVFC